MRNEFTLVDLFYFFGIITFVLYILTALGANVVIFD